MCLVSGGLGSLAGQSGALEQEGFSSRPRRKLVCHRGAHVQAVSARRFISYTIA